MPYPLGTKIGAPLTNGDAQATFGTHIDYLGVGGFRSVLTLADRDAIPVKAVVEYDGGGSGQRREGMIVYCQDTKKTYQLVIPNYATLADAGKLVQLADNRNWVNIQFGINADGEYIKDVTFDDVTHTLTITTNVTTRNLVLGGDVNKAYVDAADVTLQNNIDFVESQVTNLEQSTANSLLNKANVTDVDAVNVRINTLVNGAPQALDTLKEIADQLAADETGVAGILATQQQHTQQLTTVVKSVNTVTPDSNGNVTVPTGLIDDSVTEPKLSPDVRNKLNTKQIDYQNEIYKYSSESFTAQNGKSYVLQGNNYYNITTPDKPASGRVSFGIRVEQGETNPATYGFNNGNSLQNGEYDAQTSPGSWIQWNIDSDATSEDWTSTIGGQAGIASFATSDRYGVMNNYTEIENVFQLYDLTTLHIYAAVTRLKASQPNNSKTPKYINGNRGTIETNSFTFFGAKVLTTSLLFDNFFSPGGRVAGVSGETRKYLTCEFESVPLKPNGGTIILEDCVVTNLNAVNSGKWTDGSGTIILRGKTTVPATADTLTTIVDERVTNTSITVEQNLNSNSTTSVPSIKAVKDAVAGATIDETNLVHKTGNESIAGNKTFTNRAVFAPETGFKKPGLVVAASTYGQGAYLEIANGITDIGGANSLTIGIDGGHTAYISYESYDALRIGSGGAAGGSLYVQKDGNISIGTSTSSEKLTVNGKIESLTGGFKFPDGTIQTSAASGSSGTVDETNLVHKTGNESIAGTKNFTNKVGIGTSTPQAYLDVTGGAPGYEVSISSASDVLIKTGALFFGQYSYYATPMFGPSPHYGQRIAITNGYTSGGFIVFNGANVGIGKDLATEALDVNGFVKTSSGIKFPDGSVQTSAASGSGGVAQSYVDSQDTALSNRITTNTNNIATNTTNITNNTSGISINTTNIGTLSNLSTPNKTSIVNSINSIVSGLTSKADLVNGKVPISELVIATGLEISAGNINSALVTPYGLKQAGLAFGTDTFYGDWNPITNSPYLVANAQGGTSKGAYYRISTTVGTTVKNLTSDGIGGYINVNNSTGIYVGMRVVGVGFSPAMTVYSINGNSIGLSENVYSGQVLSGASVTFIPLSLNLSTYIMDDYIWFDGSVWKTRRFTSGIVNKSGSVVSFERDSEYNIINSGTFTLDSTIKIVGSKVVVYLGTSATQPVIPTVGYKLTSGSYVAGTNMMYTFKVGANNQIQYTITNVD